MTSRATINIMPDPGPSPGPEQFGDTEKTPKPERRLRRRQSDASEVSWQSERSEKSEKSANPVLIYDSGNYSTSSNASDSGGATCGGVGEGRRPPLGDADTPGHFERYQHVLREKDQALFLALQDVRKLRSELERLSKSEQWYKQELRTQKSTRMDALERLYTQERKYMHENQHLQRECVRLYEKCADLEKDIEAEKEQAVRRLSTVAREGSQGREVEKTSTFTIQQQTAIINDQQELIEVLRKQKRSLLNDLKQLAIEKDEKVMELQQTLASMEVENTRMTAKCKKLLDERRLLEERLKSKETDCATEEAEKLKLQKITKDLQGQLNAQERLLELKENEFSDLEKQFKTKIKDEANVDEVQRLSLAYYEEIKDKTEEIASLKKALATLQEELTSMGELQTQNEQRERVIETLNFTLEARKFELENLQQTDARKAEQIIELQGNVEKFRNEREKAVEELFNTQGSLKKAEKELIVLHEQYAHMCALCESTKFQLEVKEIEQSKLEFHAEQDKKEIEELREKLRGYLKQTEELSRSINQLEMELEKKTDENGSLNKNVEEIEEVLEREISKFKDTKKTNLMNEDLIKELREKLAESIENNAKMVSEEEFENCQVEIEMLQLKLKMNDDVIEQLAEENLRLKESRENRKLEYSEGEQNLNASSHVSGMDKDEQMMKTLESSSRENKNTNDTDLKLFSLQQQQLFDHINLQEEYMKEKTEIIAALSEALNSDFDLINSKMKTQSSCGSVNLENLLMENQKLKALLSLQNENNENLQPPSNLRVEDQENVLSVLQEQHLTHNKETINTDVESFEALKRENKDLLCEIRKTKEAQHSLVEELRQQKDTVLELRTNLEQLERLNEISKSHENETQEISDLKAKIAELEQQLQLTIVAEDSKREERIRLINKLLQQQNERVQQLNNTQREFEELLQALNTSQKQQANTSDELALKRVELEELNALFAEQNEELQQLQQFTLLIECKRLEDEEKLKATFQQQLNVMQAQLSEKLKENEEQKFLIEDLRRRNERLEADLNEDYAHEVGENKKQLRILHSKIEKLQQERDSYAERMDEMERELNEMRQTKREALVIPELVLFRDSSPETEIEIDVEEQSAYSPLQSPQEKSIIASSPLQSPQDKSLVAALTPQSPQATEDRLRILTKVLESEYRRKMKRYDLHIRSLLNNVKNLKKALRVAEEKASSLSEEKHQTAEDLHELQMTRRHLEEMRLKFEQSQSTIKTLEQALIVERKKFEASDLGKSRQLEPAHEVANLIDDYKKLIQQSAVATRRPKTSTILDLIQRSNQCVPNLNKLESSIDDLSNDIQQFIVNYARNINNPFGPSAMKVPSLMDELRAATENNF